MPRWVVIDFESASGCDLKKSGSYRYAEDPTTEVLCLSYEDDRGRRGTWWPGQKPDPILWGAAHDPATFFVCHNASFERPMWEAHMVPLGWPSLPAARFADTMARACQMALPASLDGLLRALRLPQEKDMEGNRLTLGLSRPDRKTGMLPARTPAVMARVGQYCESDIGGQVAAHKRLGWLPAHERPIWELAQRVNDRGIRLDMDLVAAMQKIVREGSAPLAAEFREITGGLNFGQIQKVKAWVISRGVQVDNLAKETLAALLGETEESDAPESEDDERDGDPEQHIELPADVRRALSIRQLIGSASIKKLTAMEHCVGYDGRARGLLVYHGTTPGRQTAKLLQPHNFPRGSLKVDGESPDIQPLVDALMTGDAAYVEALYGPPVEAVVSALRHTIRADSGRVLVAGDFAGIQARTVLALAGQHDKTKLMAEGADVYCDMASQIYKRPIDKKLDPAERQVGKNSVLGLGFQMGGRTFHEKYGKGHTREFMDEVVQVYRTEWAPLVPKVWRGLQDAAANTVWRGYPHSSHGVTYRLEDNWLTAHVEGMPDDCKLWYWNPQKVTREMPWSTEEEPDFRKGWSYQVTKNKHLITRDAFGGQLTENVVMKIERELVEHAKALLDANGFPVVLEVHDEIVCEPLAADADMAAFHQMMLDCPAWVRKMQIPVAIDAWSGTRYKK